MDNQLLKSKKLNLKSHHADNRLVNKNLFKGSLVATFIAATPFLFYLYEYIPAQPSWETLLFTYQSNFYQDVQVAVWAIAMKLIPLLLLFVWFFTCRHWWYHALLVPITMFVYQLFGTINSDMEYFDEFQLIYLVPLMALIIPSIYLIRAKMFNEVNDAHKSMEELEEEFKVSPKGLFGKLSDYF